MFPSHDPRGGDNVPSGYLEGGLSTFTDLTLSAQNRRKLVLKAEGTDGFDGENTIIWLAQSSGAGDASGGLTTFGGVGADGDATTAGGDGAVLTIGGSTTMGSGASGETGALASGQIPAWTIGGCLTGPILGTSTGTAATPAAITVSGHTGGDTQSATGTASPGGDLVLMGGDGGNGIGPGIVQDGQKGGYLVIGGGAGGTGAAAGWGGLIKQLSGIVKVETEVNVGTTLTAAGLLGGRCLFNDASGTITPQNGTFYDGLFLSPEVGFSYEFKLIVKLNALTTFNNATGDRDWETNHRRKFRLEE